MQIFGYEVSKESARQAYEQAGIKAEDVDVCELHDCFTSNELVTYEEPISILSLTKNVFFFVKNLLSMKRKLSISFLIKSKLHKGLRFMPWGQSRRIYRTK